MSKTQTELKDVLEKLRQTAGISLVAKRATLVAARNGSLYEGRPMNSGSVELFYDVALSPRESVEIPGGENLEKLEGVLHLRTGEIGHKDDQQAIGAFTYIAADRDEYDPHPACFEGWVHVTTMQLRELVDAARVGTLPSHIRLGVTGLEYAGLPDGSQKRWKGTTSDHRHEFIREATWVIPLAAQTPKEDDEEVPSALPPTRGDVQKATESVTRELARSSAELKAGLRGLWWLVLVLGGLALLFSK